MISMIAPVILMMTITVPTFSNEEETITENDYIDLFNTILHHIKADYVEEVDSKKLWQGAIHGMLAALNDDRTEFYGQKQWADLIAGSRGNRGGIGLSVTIRDSYPVVSYTLDDSPAMRAGIQSGDKILQINGKSTRDVSLSDVIRQLGGTPGTELKITIARDGDEDDTLQLSILREIIEAQVLDTAVIEGKNIGYIKLRQFSQSAPMDLAEAIRNFQDKKVKGLILDLRNNPGGLVTAGVDIANFFIKDGIIVSTRGRHKLNDKIERADPRKAIAADIPLVVLVNEKSYGASEFVAGAIKDHKRGIIIGINTFGSISVQSVIPLDDKTGLKMTIQSYFTPSGQSIYKKGIKPDIEAKPYEFTKKERFHIRDIIETKILEKFIKENKTYNEDSVKKLKTLLKENDIILTDYALRYVLKREINRMGKPPVYDLELDTQLLKALEQFKESIRLNEIKKFARLAHSEMD